MKPDDIRYIEQTMWNISSSIWDVRKWCSVHLPTNHEIIKGIDQLGVLLKHLKGEMSLEIYKEEKK